MSPHRVARLGRALRDADLNVCLTDEIDAARALGLVDSQTATRSAVL